MIVLVTKDLLAGSQVAPAVRAVGMPFASVPNASALERRLAESAPRMVLIDLNTPALDLASLVPAIRTAAPEAVIVAFGPHVHTERLRAAREAGCHAVLTRGQLVSGLPDLLSQLDG